MNKERKKDSIKEVPRLIHHEYLCPGRLTFMNSQYNCCHFLKRYRLVTMRINAIYSLLIKPCLHFVVKIAIHRDVR